MRLSACSAPTPFLASVVSVRSLNGLSHPRSSARRRPFLSGLTLTSTHCSSVAALCTNTSFNSVLAV